MDDAERRQEISARIKALRERRGLTQPQVAERLGMASKLRTYQNWELGGGTSHDNYERLAEILGVSYDYLLTGAESSPPADDILARLDAGASEAAGLREAVEALREELRATRTELLAEIGKVRAAQAAPSATRRPSRRSSGSKRS